MKISTNVMKRLIQTFSVVLVCSLLIVAGCDNGSLTLDPRDELPEDAVWQDPALIEAFLNDIYSGIGLGYGDPMASVPGAVDEAMNIHGHDGLVVVQSTLTPTDRGIWDAPGWRPATNPPYEQYHWQSVYSRIRNINIFLENVQAGDALPSGEKEVLLGEARFLRGYYYHNLMKLYGGIPVIDQVFELQDDLQNFQVPRNSFEETIDFIVADLDAAAGALSIEGRRKGSATIGAALALKCRVLVYAASDLYNENASGMPETGYTGGTPQERWQKAKDACQAVIDLGVYSLEPAPTPEAYHELFSKENPSGTIWARYFSQEGGFTHDQSLFTSPNGYNSWGGDVPTQQHVDAYEMADGSQFEWEGGDPVSATEPIDVENPYENRDPRLKANIQFNNKEWRERPSGINQIDPLGKIQTGWYENPQDGGSMNPGIQGTLRSGLDTRESNIQPWNGTRTGYYLAKFVDRDIAPDLEQAFNPWVFLRYAEVLLNFAEASAELGETGDALGALNDVRNRVGMPDVPPDGGPNRTLMERIRQEREVELAFEGHRYFDVRRWMIGPEAYQNAMGIRVVGELDENGELLVNNRYNFLYDVIKVQDRAWNDKNYFLPIARDEIDKNPNLVQNPGY